MLRSSEFIANQQVPQSYQQKRAIELHSYFSPIAEAVKEETLKISECFSLAQTYYGAMEMLREEHSAITDWDLQFKQEQDEFLNEIIEKETYYYELLNLKESKMPVVREFEESAQ